ncbi:MAG TPA: hypothetical protein VM677_01475 [Actinokineospora sp.]|jgi:hypothetical protein|nr:hypothetical protein [Actinokineospora sp.]
MKRAQFDDVLREFDEQIMIHPIMEGAKRPRRGKYLTRERVMIEFVTHRDGWDPEDGWRFLVGITDTNRTDEWGNALDGAYVQYNPARVVDVVGETALMDLYDDWPKDKEDVKYLWFIFDDQERLRAVLNLVLKPALDFIGSWIRENVTQ